MKVRVADERKHIEILIGEELEGSPLEGQEALFVKYGEEYEVDPLLAVAIAYHESKYCKAYAEWHYTKFHNCSGIMDGGQENGLVTYSNWESFIKSYNRLLRKYLDEGKDTISKIGNKYAPRQSHYLNQSWNGAVNRKYRELWTLLEN